MTKIEKIRERLNRFDSYEEIKSYKSPLINYKENKLFVMGKINEKEFTCSAMEINVFQNSELSIIL